MKKKIIKAIQLFVVVYLGTFSIWLMLIGACMGQRDISGYEIDCGDNSFTRIVKVTHYPLINLLKR